MPQVTITLPANAWSKEEKAVAIDNVTKALHDAAESTGVLKRLDMDDLKPYINIQVHESAEGGYAIGGKVFG